MIHTYPMEASGKPNRNKTKIKPDILYLAKLAEKLELKPDLMETERHNSPVVKYLVKAGSSR